PGLGCSPAPRRHRAAESADGISCCIAPRGLSERALVVFASVRVGLRLAVGERSDLAVLGMCVGICLPIGKCPDMLSEVRILGRLGVGEAPSMQPRVYACLVGMHLLFS